MTGTAMTEARGVRRHLQARSHRDPDQRAVRRADSDDEVYRTTREKYDAIVEQVLECHKRQQPVLIGTVSIEKSEALAAALQEAQDPAQRAERPLPRAGSLHHRPGRPARRGDDRHQHGRPRHRHPARRQSRDAAQGRARGDRGRDRNARCAPPRSAARSRRRAKIVVEAGGLFVVGSERHESRRIDNQLRGRSGRQGDPGASKFFVSLEDDLMRIFGSERMDSMLQRLGLKEGEAIIHPWVNKALAKAQQKVEARNYDIRKQLLKYDDVMNDQRKVVYEQRREIMNAPRRRRDRRRHARRDDRRDRWRWRSRRIRSPSSGTSQALHAECLRLLALDLPVAEWAKEEGITRRRDRGAHHRRRRPQDGREVGQLRRRSDAHGREEPAAAAPRPDLEGPPAVARPSAPGDQSARLCPARPAQRIQARGLRTVRGDAGAICASR